MKEKSRSLDAILADRERERQERARRFASVKSREAEAATRAVMEELALEGGDDEVDDDAGDIAVDAPAIQPVAAVPGQPPASDPPAPSSKQFTCGICGKGFDKERSLRSHVVWHVRRKEVGKVSLGSIQSTLTKLDAGEAQKKALLEAILAEWNREKSKLRIFCKTCETEMLEFNSINSHYFRCPNFPDCVVTAHDFYINQVNEGKDAGKKIVVERRQGDMLVVYQYDTDKNMIYIFEVYSEAKIFL